MSLDLSARSKLYRDTENGMIAGVCAGLADYLGTGRGVTRLVAVLMLMVFTLPTAVAYLAAIILLDPKPATLYRDRREEEFWRSMHRAPRDTLGNVRMRFRDMDRRLRQIESYLTSRKFTLDREFEKIRD